MAFTAEQRANASTIAQVGQQMGMSQRDILIGLMTAMQESGLRNLHYGDRDSQGLFQQRPSMGWGTVKQVTTPSYAARKFFEGLKGVGGRDSMSLTRAAQAVQRSAYPDAYAKHESSMRALMGEIGAGGAGGASGGFQYQELDVPQGESYEAGRAALNALALGQAGQAASSSGPNLNLVESNEVDLSKTIPIEDENPEGEGESEHKVESLAIADAGQGAQEVLNPITSQQAPGSLGSEGPGNLSTGKPGTEVDTKKGFVPLGGDYTSMPSPGTAGELIQKALSFKGTPYKWGGTSPLGFDCSGFTQYLFKQFGVNLPRVSYQQGQGGRAVSMAELMPGDLIFYDTSSRNNGADHVAIYAGKGMQVEANNPAGRVTYGKVRTSGAWARRYL